MTSPRKARDLYFTPEEYLAAERVSETKHEYLAGVIYAMAGGSEAHSRIAGNIATQLNRRFEEGDCFAYSSDRRVHTQRLGSSFYYYPDVTVDCSGSRKEESDEPTVIFEVLSPSTDRADRGDKLVNYQSLPSLKAYVLVDQFRTAITVYRRGPDGIWNMEFLGDLASELALPEIGCSLSLSAIYHRVF